MSSIMDVDTPATVTIVTEVEKFKSILASAHHPLDREAAFGHAQYAAAHGYLDIIEHMRQMKPAVLDAYAYSKVALTAAAKGHLNVFRYILEKEPSTVTKYDLVSIAQATARSGHLPILVYLTEKEPNCILQTGWPRHRESALELLMETKMLDAKELETVDPRGAIMNAINRSGQTIGHVAAEKGHLDLIRYFAERDSSYLSTTYNKKEQNLAHTAASKSQWDTFWCVVAKDPSLLMQKDVHGNFPLLLAVENNGVNKTALKRLVQEHDLQLDDANNWGETIAHKAARHGNLDLIVYIDEREPYAVQREAVRCPNTVAGVAAIAGHWDITQYLTAKYPSVYFQDDLLHLAVERNIMDWKTLKFLLEEKKLRLNLRETNMDRNLAYLSIKNNNTDMFRYLVEKDPSLLSLEVSCGSKDTVAHFAARKRYLTKEIIALAVEKTPVIFAEKDDAKGNSLLHQIIEQNLVDCDILEKLFAKQLAILTDTNKNGDTLAHAAVSASSEDPHHVTGLLNDIYALERSAEAQAKISQIIGFVARKQPSILARRNNDGDTVAHIAARRGHVLVLIEIAELSPSIITKTDRGMNNIVHLLAATKQLTLPHLKMFVHKGVPLLGSNAQGETVAHIAARSGLVEVVEYVMQKEPMIVRRKNMLGRTFAFTAAEKAQCWVIMCVTDTELLFDSDNAGNTIFHLMLRSGTLDSYEFWETFGDTKIPLDLLLKPDKSGLSAVYLAAQVGFVDIIQRIAEERPSLLVQQTRTGESVLFHAVRHNQLEVVQTILASNVKYAARNIHLLFQFSNEFDVLEIVRSMEECDEKLSARDKKHLDEMAIHCAIENGYGIIVKHLLDTKKVNVNQPDPAGRLPIFTAVRCKHYDIFQYLVAQEDIDVLKTDRRDNNILFEAMEMDDLSVLRYVLDKKKVPIDVDWRNKAGYTILYLAVRNAIRRGEAYHSETMRYLIERKHANVNLVYQRRKTLFSYAAAHERYDICEYLREHGAVPSFNGDGLNNSGHVSRSSPSEGSGSTAVFLPLNEPQQVNGNRPSATDNMEVENDAPYPIDEEAVHGDQKC